jgi:hypothetical protein
MCGVSWGGRDREEDSSFLKKRSKKLLRFGVGGDKDVFCLAQKLLAFVAT